MRTKERKLKFYVPLMVVFLSLCLSFFGSQQLYAQTQSVITGTVVDETGEPVIGATVSAEGGKVGGITDFDGNFSVKVPVGTKISISYIGYKTEVIVAKKGANNVVLKQDATMLQEVQVVGYGVQKKVTVTGSVSSVGGKALTETPTGSINNMLAGAVTGLSSVQISGEPGSDAASIYIRGKGTFNSDGQAPLLQVDGVERSFNDLDPNEIESITVLKDASATAVYGVRGANGVILVTTKRGQEGKAKVSFSTNFSMVTPSKPLELTNSYQYATFHNAMSALDGTAPMFSDEIVEHFRTGDSPILYPNIDWIDFVLSKVTLQTQHNMNISGGTKTARYFISVGAYTQDGMFKQQNQPYDNSYNFKRFNYRANLDLDVTKTTLLSMNLNGIIANKLNPQGSQGATGFFKNLYYATPFSSPGVVDGMYVNSSTDYGLPFTGATGMSYYGKGYTKATSNTLNVDLILNQKLDFITKGLSFKLKGSYNSSFTDYKYATQGLATYIPVKMDDGSISYKKSGENQTMSYSTGSGYARNWYMDVSFNYDRDFGLHHVGALVLYNQSKTYYPKSYPAIPTGYVGLVGRVAYDWNNRYMAEFNIGYNGSENFHKKRRFGTFPAVSVGWVISDEPFFKPITKVVTFAKLRATYGMVGNDKVGGTRFMYTPDPYYVNNSTLFNRDGGRAYDFGVDAIQNGAYEAARNNEDVTWEKAYKQNYGIDINFLDDRLRGSFDYYREHRKDILLRDGTAPNIIGFQVPYANLGEVKSWGWEISLNWQDKIGENFKYNVGLNMSHNQNEIIEMKESPLNYDYQYQKGHRIGSRSLYKFWKFYYEGCEADYEKEFGKPFPEQIITNSNLLPGDCIYVDLNGDGKIDTNDMSRELGSKTDDPEYILGLNLGFTWKDLTVSTRWTGGFKVSRMLDGTFRRPFHSNNDNTTGGLLKYMYENTWSETNTGAFYPRPTFDRAAAQNYASSTLYETNADYLRLKSINISYNLKIPFLKRLKIERCAVSFSGYNIFTISGFNWGDPESYTTDAPQYPLTKSYSLGLQLNF